RCPWKEKQNFPAGVNRFFKGNLYLGDRPMRQTRNHGDRKQACHFPASRTRRWNMWLCGTRGHHKPRQPWLHW
ncbi:hypothetical protein LEMLEM_LOCUS19934, partial [Lemmus lemmus]